MIDLDGKAPVIGTIRECAMHFAMFKPFAKAPGAHPPHPASPPRRPQDRTWILEPEEIERLAERLKRED